MQTLFRSATLTTTHLWFTVRTTTILELDAYSGASLRGSFFNAIWYRFCTNKSAISCGKCPLHEACPVSAIVAPLREESVLGQDIPRPYVIIPPLEGERRYLPDEHFSFGMTFFGNIVQLLPYIMLSLSQLEAEGLGRRLDENNGERGRFQVESVEVYHPWTADRQTIYAAGSTRVNSAIISVRIEECLRRAETLHQEELRLQFITPLRLVDREHLVKDISLRPLIQRLLERYVALEQFYGNADFVLSRDDKIALLQQAEAIACSADRTRWQELKSYSNRQKRTTPIGGLLGDATFTGDLSALLPILIIGELIHVGKNVVKGNGWYRIVQDADVDRLLER
jgi:CRISPR-associated endoribonuclease Cas6